MKTSTFLGSRVAVTGALMGLLSGSALAASAYTQTWSGATTESWEANTIGSVGVFDAAVGNPAGSIASRFDPGWSDVPAMANGWIADPQGSTVSFALTMSDVYRTKVRLALTGETRSALVHLDNFVQTPVVEPQTWALTLSGLLTVTMLARRRSPVRE